MPENVTNRNNHWNRNTPFKAQTSRSTEARSNISSSWPHRVLFDSCNAPKLAMPTRKFCCTSASNRWSRSTNSPFTTGPGVRLQANTTKMMHHHRMMHATKRTPQAAVNNCEREKWLNRCPRQRYWQLQGKWKSSSQMKIRGTNFPSKPHGNTSITQEIERVNKSYGRCRKTKLLDFHRPIIDQRARSRHCLTDIRRQFQVRFI